MRISTGETRKFRHRKKRHIIIELFNDMYKLRKDNEQYTSQKLLKQVGEFVYAKEMLQSFSEKELEDMDYKILNEKYDDLTIDKQGNYSVFSSLYRPIPIDKQAVKGMTG